MLSIDFNEISAVRTGGSGVERIYVGTDIVWTESEPMQFAVETADGQVRPFDLSAIETEYDELDPFMLTYDERTFAGAFAAEFGRYIERAPAVKAVRDNQSTDDYGIKHLAGMQGLSAMEQAVFPKAELVYDSCFRKCRKLSSLSLPSLTAAGADAFILCESLPSVDFPKLKIIGDTAFSWCVSLTAASFGSLEVVPPYTFYPNGDFRPNIEEVSIPNALCVDAYGMSECRKLKKVYSPSLRGVGMGAFAYDESLSSITLDKVEYIDRRAFEGTALKAVDVPQCSSIGGYAFAWAGQVSSLYAPSLDSIGEHAFDNCMLRRFSAENVGVIGPGAISGDLREMHFNRLQELGERALMNAGVSSITIHNRLEDGVPVIPAGETESFRPAIQPSCLVYVDDEDVYRAMCESEGLSSTEYRVFHTGSIGKTVECGMAGGWTRSLTVDKTTKTLRATADGGETLERPFNASRDLAARETTYYSASDYVSVEDRSAGISALADGCFRGFGALSSASFGECVALGDYAFHGCGALASLDMPRVLSVGSAALDGTALSAVDFPEAVYVASGAFVNMNGLESIRCASATELGPVIIDGCQSLTSLELPSLPGVDEMLATSVSILKRLNLSSASYFDNPITIGPRLPSQLSAVNLASVPFDRFQNEVSAKIARGFAPGCSLTCSDGVYTL